MRIYPSIRDFNEAESPAYAHQQDERTYVEADWGVRLRGAGAPGGDAGGWLLTFSQAPTADGGALLAYEIGAGGNRTGRVAIIRRGWDKATDQAQLTKAQQDPTVWRLSERNTRGEADITVIDELLPGDQID